VHLCRAFFDLILLEALLLNSARDGFFRVINRIVPRAALPGYLGLETVAVHFQRWRPGLKRPRALSGAGGRDWGRAGARSDAQAANKTI
jgi:hypothetical protein